MRLSKLAVLQFFYLIPYFVFGYDSDTTLSKFGFGFEFSLGSSDRIINIDSDENGYKNYKKWRDIADRPKLGGSGGLNVSYSFNEFISLRTGLIFSNYGYRRYTESWSDSTGIVLEGEANIKYSYYYLGAPIYLNCNLPLQNFSIYFDMGYEFVWQIKSQYKAKIRYYYTEIEETLVFDRADEFIWLNVPVWELSDFHYNHIVHLKSGIEVKLNQRSSMRLGSFSVMFYYRHSKNQFEKTIFCLGGI